MASSPTPPNKTPVATSLPSAPVPLVAPTIPNIPIPPTLALPSPLVMPPRHFQKPPPKPSLPTTKMPPPPRARTPTARAAATWPRPEVSSKPPLVSGIVVPKRPPLLEKESVRKSAQFNDNKILESINRAKTVIQIKAEEQEQVETHRLALEDKLNALKKQLETELVGLEDEIGRGEEEYITKTWSHGNVMRGWDGFVKRVERERGGNGSGTATGAPKYRKSKPNDRMFSLSSNTSHFRKLNPDVAIVKKGVDKKKKKRQR